MVGSGTGILFGAPMLILIGFAPQSELMLWVTVLLCALYMALLLAFISGRLGRRRGRA